MNQTVREKTLDTQGFISLRSKRLDPFAEDADLAEELVAISQSSSEYDAVCYANHVKRYMAYVSADQHAVVASGGLGLTGHNPRRHGSRDAMEPGWMLQGSVGLGSTVGYTYTISGLAADAAKLVMGRNFVLADVGREPDQWDRALAELQESGPVGSGLLPLPPYIVRAIERVIPLLTAQAVRFPSFEVDDEDRSVTLRWKKPGAARSFVLIFRKPEEVVAVLTEPGSLPGFYQVIDISKENAIGLILARPEIQNLLR